MTTTTIEQMENVVDIVSDLAVEAILVVTKALSPDGRPFMMQELTEEEQLMEYITLKSGGRKAFLKAIQEDATIIVTKLEEAGVEPDLIKSAHPFDIAVSNMIQHSALMEEKMRTLAIE